MGNSLLKDLTGSLMENRDQHIGLRVEPSVMERVVEYAQRTGKTKAEVAYIGLLEYLDRQEKVSPR